MANETTTTALNDFVDTMLADAIFQLVRVGVMPPKVRRISLVGFPGKAGNFNKWDAKASSDVQAGTEGTDYSTNLQVTSSTVAASVDEHLLMSVITDLSRDSSVEDVSGGIGITLGNAMGAKLDDDLIGLFSGFTGNTVAGAGVTLINDHIMQALELLHSDAAPGPFWGVFHPKQIWGPKGFSGILDTTAASSNAAATPLATRLQETGLISNYAGIGIDFTPEIDPDVASGGDAAGGIFSSQAIGLSDKGIMNVELERNASMRGYEIVVQGLWKEAEIVDNWGVYVLSDVA